MRILDEDKLEKLEAKQTKGSIKLGLDNSLAEVTCTKSRMYMPAAVLGFNIAPISPPNFLVTISSHMYRLVYSTRPALQNPQMKEMEKAHDIWSFRQRVSCSSHIPLHAMNPVLISSPHAGA